MGDSEIEYLEEAGIGPKQVILNKRFFTVSEKHIIPGLQSDCLCNFWKLIIKGRSRGNSSIGHIHLSLTQLSFYTEAVNPVLLTMELIITQFMHDEYHDQ